ncbi:uncharacterized protein K444DRAFT_363221 [Hyaloscypha bicolor E]|uniref:Heterokaryon incompatibility domain-containing protein n=1 Tax=Hyaloscypha bicolor E TaxID=1095630 RepID=A0A2J6TGM8_9HELO|nr:uncharacterized protein K444DRAFT_363221 [Hyaloscypha bicolor E]PMD62165.1 hypothetical protein K444DRAFT_363221 [Hyaloscypha bicolor E]
MDFLPYPDDPAQAGIEVPFFCTDANLARYVPPEAFSVDFPSSIIDYLFLKMAESNDMLEIAVLAQAGIYLRVLRELVGESFDVRDFVTTGTLDPGLRVITLRRLNESCGWSKKWLFDRDKVFQQLLQDLFRGNQHATSAFFQCVALLETFEPPCWTIGFSIWALLWSVSPRRTSRFYEFRRRTGAQWPEHRLIGAGWCPYWTRVYAQKLSPIQLYYMSGIPHVRHAGHGECPPAGPCTVYDVEYATYQTKHATSCSKTDCAFRGVDGRRLDDLSSIISRGGIPLIRLRPRDDSPSAHIDIEVVEHAYGKPYIAISHVWSGGLGNFSENTLPQCQLDFLYRSARSCRQKLYGAKANKHDISYGNRDGGRDLTETTDWLEGDISLLPLYYGLKGWFWLQNALERVVLGATGEDTSTIYLWIDTLCIPANPAPDEKRLQRKAIDSMALVYSMAMQVLVIDQSVRELSVQTETGLSLAAELMSCPWMTRSWTYQEGSLSRQTTFLLMDGWVNPKHLSLLNAGGVVRKPPRTFVKALMREFLDGLNDMPDLLNRSVHGSSPQEPALFVQIWNDLASRRTSIPDDLHGLLAVLLGLSAQEILDPQMRSHKSDAGEDKRVPAYDDQKTRSSAERMLAVYLSQASLPLSMIFTSFPPNTPMCNNNDWMPRFPTGSLDLEFGTMRWDCSGLDKIGGLSFSLRNSNLEAVMTQSSVETLNGTIFSSPSLLRTTHLPNNEKGVNTISVFLNPNSLENLRRVPAGSTLCILIHARTNLGACCFLSDKENDVDARMRLNFICPLTWELQSTTRGIQSNAGGDIVDLEPGSIITDRICVLSCGKASAGFV